MDPFVGNVAGKPDVALQHSLGILEMVSGSGPVVLFVLYILIFFSVVSWGIVLYKFRQLRRAKVDSARFDVVFWETKNLPAIETTALELAGSPLAQVFLGELNRLTRVTESDDLNKKNDGSEVVDKSSIDNVERAMRRAIREQVTRLERALSFLATTASTAPFIGLFGTVWGIMNAFRGLSLTRTSTIQAVAPGIAEALIATAIGLAAAIPSVMAYNHFSRKVRVQTADMENFALEFLNIAKRHFL